MPGKSQFNKGKRGGGGLRCEERALPHGRVNSTMARPLKKEGGVTSLNFRGGYQNHVATNAGVGAGVSPQPPVGPREGTIVLGD